MAASASTAARRRTRQRWQLTSPATTFASGKRAFKIGRSQDEPTCEVGKRWKGRERPIVGQRGPEAAAGVDQTRSFTPAPKSIRPSQ
jgi:hypothetical protein